MGKKEGKRKLSTNAKKVIILCSMVGLLVVTGVLNFVLNNNNNLLTETTSKNPQLNTTETFFATYRTDREVARAEEISYLESIMKSEDASAESIASAEAKKMNILENIEQELVVEKLIKSKGFKDVVVTMGSNSINVIVDSKELTNEEVAQILGIILSETSYTPSDVIVIPYAA